MGCDDCGDCGACETAAILADPEMMAAIHEGEAAIAAGDVLSSEDLDRFLRARRTDHGEP